MPEGPEVRIFADCLAETLDRGPVTITAALYSSRAKEEYTVFGVGDVLSDVWSRGKKLVFSVTRENTNFYVVNSVIMTGRWSYVETEDPLITLELTKPSGESVWWYYHDPRKLSFFDTVLDIEEHLSKIGPEWLVEDITLEQFRTAVKSRYVKDMEVCKFLMEQKYFSGIGNYLKSEILFAARIDPRRSMKSLSDSEIEALHYECSRLPRESYHAGGLTIQTYYDPRGRKGSFEPQIYSKSRVTVDGVTYPVQTGEFSDKRTTWFVSF